MAVTGTATRLGAARTEGAEQAHGGLHFLFLNVGHFLDHYVMLVFATVAALALAREWGLAYAELIPYATPGFLAFGLCAYGAGWLADRWSREGMMVVFFLGIGAGAIGAAQAGSPLGLGVALLVIGLFASIYHPVGIALVMHGRARTGLPIAVNGIFGNLGVAVAALATGYLIDVLGWRAAFRVPGVVCIAIGIAYLALFARAREADPGAVPAPASGGREGSGGARGGAASGAPSSASPGPAATAAPVVLERRLLVRAFAVIFATTAIGGLIFQSTTFALPKVLAERLADDGLSATLIGWYAFVVFAVAAVGQVVVGFLVDRLPARRVFAVTAGAQAVLLWAMIGQTGTTAVLLAGAFMLVVFGQIPINDVLVGRITRPAWRSRVLALRYLVTFTVMASSVPFIAWMHAEWGFDALFMVLSGAAAAIVACVLALPRVERA